MIAGDYSLAHIYITHHDFFNLLLHFLFLARLGRPVVKRTKRNHTHK